LFTLLVRWNASVVCLPPGANVIKKYGVELQLFIVSFSVCPWQAITA
jgi:hypothetical protein